MVKVSIIVPVYKVEKYLNKCIDSILRQTISDIEVILVDDGSPDNCGIICDEYAKRDVRIKVIHKNNGGLSSARNAGIDIAKGDYIGFVDSDDWIDKDMYELLYSTAMKCHADVVECSYRCITEEGIIEETNNTGEIIEADNIFALNSQYDWKYFKSLAVNKIYHKNIFSDGKRYPLGKTHEDEFFTHEAFYSAKKLVYIDVSKYNYLRMRNDSITGSRFDIKSLDACEAFEERIKFFKKNNIESLLEKAELARNWVVNDRFTLALKELDKNNLDYERMRDLKIISDFFFNRYGSIVKGNWKKRDLFKIRLKIYFKYIYFLLKRTNKEFMKL